jgi:hypothetical protein
MFGVDGLPDYPNLPEDPIAGPNAVLANNMGVVMGTSHHEPMDRNKPEWDHIGKGPWDWTNKDVLTKVGANEVGQANCIALEIWCRKSKGERSIVHNGDARGWR